MRWRELPKVGDRVRVHFDGNNPNNWPCWGDVVAVGQGRAGGWFVVERWLPRRRSWYPHLIDFIDWTVRGENFEHRRRGRTVPVTEAGTE